MTPAVGTQPAVCLIIVSWNSASELPRCLGAVAAQTRLPDRVIVIDNASDDASATVAEREVARLPALAGRTDLHRLERNLGFAAANNMAVGMADGDLVALLNPDAFPEPSWLESLLAAAAAHPEAAAFGSLQMMDGSPGIVDGCGDVYHVSGLTWRAGHGRALRSDDLREREVFSACAAAALYRRPAFVAAGLFDEDFFCYLEDVDLGFRLRLGGHAARHVPAAVVHHVGSASSGGRRSSFAVYHGHRNLVWCFVKNMPQPLLTLLLLPHLAQTIVTFTTAVCRGQAGAFLAAKRDALTRLGTFLRKRRLVHGPGRRTASWWRIWRMLDGGWWRR
jgi:GT2 family glycosyltransferase